MDWRLQGVAFASCNCNWGCPCQFNALPSSGQCTGGLTMRVERGHFGSESLDGVVWGFYSQWPGAVHEGNGRMLVFVDQRASAAQRRAIVEVCHGRHSAEGTFFNIFSAMSPTKLEPVYAPIEFQWDLEQRLARVVVPGVFDIRGEPIRNPITGDPHFPRLVLPNGFEFKEAEFASADTRGLGPIPIDRKQGHAHFARVHWGPSGYIH